MAYVPGKVSEHARIKVRGLTTVRETGMNEHTLRDPARWKQYTTVGRVIFGELLPRGVPFEAVNLVMTKKEITKLIDTCYRKAGHRETVMMLDRIKDLGYFYETRAGIAISIGDMPNPTKRAELHKKAHHQQLEN